MVHQSRPEESYRATVNLPRTDFPMRAQLPWLEPEILHLWEQLDLYHQARERTAGHPSFLLPDGLSFSPGEIPLKLARNKILKDIIIKFRSMQGYDAPFVPGWDAYGLPAEIAALRTFYASRQQIDPLALRQRCAEMTRKAIDQQRRQYIRLGIRAEWDRPHLTMQPAYEAAVLDVLGALVAAGAIQRGLLPVYWCPHCESALAEAEIAYLERDAHAIYVAFPIAHLPDAIFPADTLALMSAVIWTTAPWTLPANVALAVHPDMRYVLLTDARDREGFTYIVAAEAMARFADATLMQRPKVLGEVRGQELAGTCCQHPFMAREAPVVADSSVSAASGTGLAHLAPGQSRKDFAVSRNNSLPVIQLVGPTGILGQEAGPFAGQYFDEAEEAILRRMDRDGTLLMHDTNMQEQPHCWRCRQPVIERATPQWLVNIAGLRAVLHAAIDGVDWHPAWGRARMANLVDNRPDWCISRQRAWGTPIPALYCAGCQVPLFTPEIIAYARDIIRDEGGDAWFRRPARSFTPPGTVCSHCGGKVFRKGTDILDVWFDAGCGAAAQRARHQTEPGPASLCLEGQEQYRGWLQASLITGAVLEPAHAPYRAALTHGSVLNRTGRTRTKLPGNLLNPREVVERYGADVLRLWVASSDTRTDVVMSEEVFAQVIATYRRIRNTARFLLGNLYDFTPEMACPDSELEEIDRWALQRVNDLIHQVTAAYDQYAFHRVYHAIDKFCTVDLSAFYLDVAKDTLYLLEPDDPARHSVQTVLLHLITTLAQLLAPVLSFTAEEIWQRLPAARHAASVQLTDWPAPRPTWDDAALVARWATLLAVRGDVQAALGAAQRRREISQPSAAKILLYSAGETKRLLESYEDILARLFRVSVAEVALWNDAPRGAYQGGWPQLAVRVSRAAGASCARCRRWRSLGAQPGFPGLCACCASLLATQNAINHRAA